MSDIARATKAVTFLAENSGVIVVNAQRKIEGHSNPMYALERIKEETFNVKDGESTREIITHITQPRRSEYTPIFNQGNETLDVPNPQTGELESVSGDKVGRGCSLAADTMQFGYDVRTSCMKARAVEIGPFCVLDLVRKNAHRQVIQRLWDETPDILKAQFARQLLRDVVMLGKFKWAVTAGMPYNVDQAGFPAVPTGGPDIGAIRRIANLVMPWGWSEGSMTPMIDGHKAFQVFMGADAIEWAIETRKVQKGFKVETTRTANDKTFGDTVIYEGIQFIADMRPMRVVLIPTAGGAHRIEEIEPTIVVPAEGEGFKEIPNAEYENDYVTRDGDRRRVYEVGFYIHPNAFVREAMGAIPAMPGGKTFNRKFDMSIRPIEDWELAAKGCNKDLFFFGYRILHAYAIKRRQYELAGAFLYIAPKPRFDIIDPWSDPDPAATASASTLAPLALPPESACEPCLRPGEPERMPVLPTCSELFPANGVGTITLRQSAYDVDESAGNLTIVVDRVGGNSGAASAVITLTEGTATNPENFTTPSGFAGTGPWTKTLNWADGVAGPVTVVVPIVEAEGDDDGKVFTAGIGTYVGATAGAIESATVTILDPGED